MARPPKSVEERRAGGNAGKRPLEDAAVSPRPDPGAEVPAPPEHLSDISKEVWIRHAPELHKLHLLTTVDLPMFEMFCSLYGTWRLYEGLCVSAGPQLAVSAGYRGAADRAIEKAKAIAEKFGLEPKSRSGIKTITVGRGGQVQLEFGDKTPSEIRADFRVVSQR